MGYGINNLGQTVGQGYQSAKIIRDANGKLISYTPAITHGWVSVGGKLRDVNGLLNGACKGWEISVARKINDRGEVLADANFNDGEVHEVLLCRMPFCRLWARSSPNIGRPYLFTIDVKSLDRWQIVRFVSDGGRLPDWPNNESSQRVSVNLLMGDIVTRLAVQTRSSL